MECMTCGRDNPRPPKTFLGCCPSCLIVVLSAVNDLDPADFGVSAEEVAAFWSGALDKYAKMPLAVTEGK